MSLTDDFLSGLKKRNVVVRHTDAVSTKKKKKDEDIAPVMTIEAPVIDAPVKESGTSFWDDILQANSMSQYDNPAAAAGAFIGKKITDEVNKGGYFKSSSLFDDGYDFGDITKTILASGRDLGENAWAGIIGMGETALDALAYAGAAMSRSQMQQNATNELIYNAVTGKETDHVLDTYNALQEGVEKDTSEFIAKDLYDEKKVAKTILLSDLYQDLTGIDSEAHSVFDEKSDALAQSAGQLAAQYALTVAHVPWWVTSGLTSFGSEAENAFNQGATFSEAGMSAAISAGAEILTEKIGGINFGKGSLDDILVDRLARGLSDKFARYAVKMGIKATGEGFEEWISNAISEFGQSLTYADETTLQELLFDEEAADSFIGGFLMSGGFGGVDAINATVKGVDYVTELTKNEQAVVEKIYNDEVAKAEKEGNVTAKKKAEIWDDVVEKMEKGYISTDDIEAVLGDRSEYDSLEKEAGEYDTLYNTATGELSKAQQDRLAELEAKNEKNPYKTALETAKENYSKNVRNLVKGDRLVESYNEKDRVYQDFQADFSKYEGAKYADAAKKTLENAMKAGANNTNRVHDLVDLAAKTSADTGLTYEFKSGEQITNDFIERQTKEIAKLESIKKRTAEQDAELKEMKDLLAKVQNGDVVVDGDITSDGIVLNLDSGKPLNRVVGHEITHSFEPEKGKKSKEYTELKDSLFAYAKTKGIDIESELKSRTLKYKGVTDADPEAELVADLVGDFLFTDSDYVKKLSVENRNVFQKIWDEVKYLCKIATAGSQEARELARLEKAFADAYRAGSKAQGDTKYSVSPGNNLKPGESENTIYIKDGHTESGETVNFIDLILDGKKKGETRSHKSLTRKWVGMAKDGLVYGRVRFGDPIEITNKSPEYQDAYIDGTEYGLKDGETKYYYPVLETEDLRDNPRPITRNGNYGLYRYSLSDSDGKKLTKEQQDYFKDSKMRDDEGNLKVMYHGSQDAGFHVFDSSMSDDGTSFFFVDRNDVAASYSGTTETYAPRVFQSVEDANNFLKEMGFYGGKYGYEVVENNGKYTLLAGDDEIATSENLAEIYEEFCDYEGVGYGDANYKVYLNLTNPLVVDAEGRNWNNISREFSQDIYDRYQSLTEAEKDALIDLSEWEDFGLFKDTIVDEKNTYDMTDSSHPLVTAYHKLGGDEGILDFYSLYDIVTDNFTEVSLRENASFKLTTRDYAQRAKEQGYDGVIFKNIVDNGGYSNGSEGASTVAIAFDSNQIKSVANEKPTADKDIRYSLSSMANTFFGDENMTADQFKKADYKQTQGYRDYVDQCLNNYKQTRADFDEESARKSIEDSIEGIVQVAIAAKQAGYDIYDDATKRSQKDSKNRLLFSSLEPNSDYFTSNDISTICDKRKNFADIYDDIVRAEEAKGVPVGKRFFDNVDNYFYLHKLMADKGLTQPCRQCYVESMRKNLAPMANAFLRLVQETNPDNTANDQLFHQKGKQKGELKTSNASTREFVLSALAAHPEYGMTASDLTIETLTTEDGLAQLKLQAPLIYEAFNSFYGQSKPKMPKSATPFRFGELTALLTDEKGRIKKSLIDKINSTGGFRLQSYSDFQIQNYTDVLQVLFEAGTLGLNGHAYTKVPAFLEATEGTNLKRNISIFMYKDGDEWKLDKNDSFPYDLEEIYDLVKADKSGNTGIIAVSQNADMSAWIMANDYVGYGIPFHKSGLKMGTVRSTDVKTDDGRVIKGYSGTIDHTKQQTEVWAKATDDHKALTKVKKGINIYSFWDFDNKSNLSKNELIEKNVKAYIDQCELAGYLPKFRAYVMNNDKVLNDVLKYSKKLGFVSEDATIADISFQYKGYTIPYGYYKFLGDFGMFNPDGKASPQQTLSLENYNFDKAVKFFSDAETLRRNEILQQFANGAERQKYKDSNLTAGELQDIVKRKRGEVAKSVVGDLAPAMSLSNQGDQFAPTGDFDIYGKDFKVQETAPIIEKPAQATVSKTETVPVAISEMETTTEDLFPDDLAPMEDSADRLASLDDEDVPPETEPYYGEEAPIAPIDPFEDRDFQSVGKRNVHAYMYDNPEVKPFFQMQAKAMLGDLQNSTKGEKWYNDDVYYESNGESGWGGTKRHTTDDIAYLLDMGYTYAQIEYGLKAIIEDNGAENIAIAKKIEFALNDRLRNGYTDINDVEIPANQDYINLLAQKQAAEAVESQIPMHTDADAPMDDIAPVAEQPVAEAYEAIRPKRERSNEPKLIRVDSAESSGKQRKWVGTSTESEVVDGKVLPDDLDQELIHYQPISNRKTLGNANARLDSMGYEASVTYLNSQFANNKVTLDDIALGERLIQEAVKRGDTKTAGDLIMDISILGTELGQKVQALSIIKRLTPEGQIKMLQRTIERGKTKGDKAFEGVELTQDMIDYILKTYGKDGTYDQAELDKRVEDVKQKIADQMDVTAMDKVNAWRYLSMLGNPKTHIRNLVSNVAMKGTVAVKNAVARTIETIAPIKNRTKTWKAASEDVKKFAQQTSIEMKDIISGDSKYSESASIKEKRAIFKNKILNGLYEFNSDMLGKEDWWFSKPAFTNALSEYLTANGIATEADIKNNPKVVEKAKQYALEQSQIATFRQYSWLSNKINEIERKNAATNIAVGAIVPFKKTPINIAKTGLNYSPLGFAKTLTYDISQVKKGNMEASELVDHLAQNVTGSALTLVGYMLASAGFLNGAGDDDKEGEYDYQLGKQAYSINIGDASFSLSWLSPVAMPLFVGANAYEQLVEGKEWNGDVVVETLAQTLDPLSEMSFLSSLDSVLSSYDSGIEKFAGIGETMAQNYITQFAPTFMSQIATVTDDTKRSTKVGADSGFKFFDETINKLMYKIPGLRNLLEPSTDIWGNEIKQSDNFLERAFEAFLAPYARREDIATAVDEEIKDLYSQTGDTGLIPSIPNNYVSYNGEKYEMSAKEFTDFKKEYGQTAFDLMEQLFATETYRNADSETRADMVNRVYDYASDVARKNYFSKQGIEFTNATEDGKEVYKEDAIKGAIEADLPVDEYSFSVEYPAKYSFFKKNGITYSDYASADEEGKRAYNWAYNNPGKYKMYQAISGDFMTFYKYKGEMYDIKADKDANGKSINGSRKNKVIDHLNSMDADYGEKIILFKSEYPADDTYNMEIVNYLNSRSDISYKEMEAILKELGFTVDEEGNIYW